MEREKTIRVILVITCMLLGGRHLVSDYVAPNRKEISFQPGFFYKKILIWTNDCHREIVSQS